MSLPTAEDLQTYLRIETDAELDNELLDELIAGAIATVEAWLDRPITAIEQTFTDEAIPDYRSASTRTLLIPMTPVAAEPPPVVTDWDGDTVDATIYRLDLLGGRILANAGESGFWNRPYTIVATVGLSAHPRYGTVIEPVLRRAILDLASVWYHQRNPAAVSVSSSGIGTTITTAEIPPRICAMLAPFRFVRGA